MDWSEHRPKSQSTQGHQCHRFFDLKGSYCIQPLWGDVKEWSLKSVSNGAACQKSWPIWKAINTKTGLVFASQWSCIYRFKKKSRLSGLSLDILHYSQKEELFIFSGSDTEKC